MSRRPRSWGRRAVTAGTGLAVAGAALTAWNRRTVPRLSPAPAPVAEHVTVCVPARNEAALLPGLIADLRAQTRVARLRILVLDDASTDDTAARALRAMEDDPRCELLRGTTGPPPGWTGKAAACAALAEHARRIGGDTGVLVFLDADVRLAPTALAAAVTCLRERGVALLAPWPRQRAETAAERLVQPLLCWSWAATLPVAWADRGTRGSTVVSCGQFLVFDAARYRAIGGHAVVAGSVTEDLDIARALRRAGDRTAVAAAGGLARTRMYRDARELVTGYDRWLWSAYGGSVAGGVAVAAAAAWAYWLPPAAAVLGRGRLRRIGLLGYLAAVTGRLLARALESGRGPDRGDLVDALVHPASVAAYLLLWQHSHRARRSNALTWRGRALIPGQELDSR
ncbi:glycosyltransferase [Nocardia testacea]|uniref:glycosyltransferase n=1 Tax=Nocardia testacea TaxID=248551 RepID=UPI000584365E|nr:glycosyltransferase family A protein [Nocardia testacea]